MPLKLFVQTKILVTIQSNAVFVYYNMQQEYRNFQSYFFRFSICWCSGLFSPELESNTKYCLERGLESSVRLCLTSWHSHPPPTAHLVHLLMPL